MSLISSFLVGWYSLRYIIRYLKAVSISIVKKSYQHQNFLFSTGLDIPKRPLLHNLYICSYDLVCIVSGTCNSMRK